MQKDKIVPGRQITTLFFLFFFQTKNHRMNFVLKLRDKIRKNLFNSGKKQKKQKLNSPME